MSNNIFPIELYAYEGEHYTSSAFEFRKDFQKAFDDQRATGSIKHYFAYDVIIHSKTNVSFVVYDMRDNIYGGIGAKLGTIDATVDPSVTEKAIKDRIYRLAKERRRVELAIIEEDIIEQYAEDYRAFLSVMD